MPRNGEMLAAVFEGVGIISVHPVPRPPIGPDEVLVRVGAAAICGTDVRIYTGQKTRGVRTPSILGHEMAGEVVQAGPEVADRQIGDRIVIAPVIACGTCYCCQRGLSNLCINRVALGYEYDGGFAQYVRIPARAIAAGNLFRIPDHVSYAEASLSEPLSCCINGQENLGICPGDSVLIVGMGPIGMMHLRLAKAIGDTRVLVSEPDQGRRQLAEETDADLVFDPGAVDLQEFLREHTDNVGVDRIIMTAGIPTAVNDLLGCLRKGGGINLFAGFPARSQSLIDPNLIHYNQLHISGASASTLRQFQMALTVIAEGDVGVETIITGTFPLVEFDKALERTMASTGLKTIIVPWGESTGGDG